MTRHSADNPPTLEQQAYYKKRKAVVGIVSGILVASTPGIYTAYKDAKSNYEMQLKIESATRDKVDDDLQANVLANTLGIESLEKRCVTNKQLLELTVKLQDQIDRRRRHSSRPPIDLPDVDFEGSIEDEIAELSEEIEAAEEVAIEEDYRKAKKSRPTMKSAKDIRNMVQQKASAGAPLEF